MTPTGGIPEHNCPEDGRPALCYQRACETETCMEVREYAKRHKAQPAVDRKKKRKQPRVRVGRQQKEQRPARGKCEYCGGYHQNQ